jgi:hypothetical protein
MRSAASNSRTSAEEKIEDDIAACRAVHDRAGHQLHWLEGRAQCKQTSLDVNVYWAFSLDFGRWKKCPIVLIVSFIKSEVMIFNKALQRQWVWCAWFAAYQLRPEFGFKLGQDVDRQNFSFL